MTWYFITLGDYEGFIKAPGPETAKTILKDLLHLDREFPVSSIAQTDEANVKYFTGGDNWTRGKNYAYSIRD